MKKILTAPAWTGRALSTCLLLTSLLFITLYNLAQGPDKNKDKISIPDRSTYKNLYHLRQKAAKLGAKKLDEKLLRNARHNFKVSILKGLKQDESKSKSLTNGRVAAAQQDAVIKASLTNPTSLQFGPDGRLYVAEQGGLIKVFTIVYNSGDGSYSVTGQEVIDLINQIPNHNDDGSPAPAVTTRQVTSLLVTGTPGSPVLYVSSSDSRMGGPTGDLNLDTNSGIVSRLTKTDGDWNKIDLVRGLPRSEENHSINGMQLYGNKLYIAVGGMTNAGSPSNTFAYITEYALSAAVLSIDLTMINAMPTKGSGNTRYKYDLPTLDDPTRSGNPDAGDPFGGNDGLNQAKIVAGGPVQIFASGFRNAYDLVITKTPGKAGRMYVMDNGPNQGWGGYPANEGGGSVTNDYVPEEPGSLGPGQNDPQVNNRDNLDFVGNLNSYTPGSFYGGHPNPVRANPNGAGLYTRNGATGVFRTSKSGTDPLPADWPPVPTANPVEGDYLSPGDTDPSILAFPTSTNGIVEYTASNFGDDLKGQLLTASFDGNIQKINLTDAGNKVTNIAGEGRLNQDVPFASNFGGKPLDVTAQGDNDIFPGTVWAVCYLENSIYVFEPQHSNCNAEYSKNIDDDGDGYSNADEIDNASNPCTSASKPRDYDQDRVSDYNDPDDDNDGIGDQTDYFALDANNGTTTTLPVRYDLFNNHPGTGLFGLGFTGLMNTGRHNYYNLYDDQNLIAGGAVGAFSVVSVSPGDAYQNLNTQENAFQFGVNTTTSTGPFTVQTRLLGNFFNSKRAKHWQSQGVYIGTGDQDNYLKLVVGPDETETGAGFEVLYEQGGVVNSFRYEVPGGLPNNTLDLYLTVDPVTGRVQPKYAKDGGQAMNIGTPVQVGGALLTAIQEAPALAVGIIASSIKSTPFTATWDFIYVTPDPDATLSALSTLRFNSGGNALTTPDGRVFIGDNYFSGGHTHYKSSSIDNTNYDELYQTERNGQFTYNLPLSNDTYQVVLHFAELEFGSASPGGEGSRKFNVDIEGERKLTEYDIFASAGGAFKAVTQTFTVNVTDGTLNINFLNGSADQAKINAIEVVSVSGGRVSAKANEGNFSLHPNPASDQLMVDLTIPASGVKATSVTDLSGKRWLRNTHKVPNQKQLVVPVRSLPPGLYLLNIRHGKGTRVLKFVKQ